MSTFVMKTPDFEHQIGLEVYWIPKPGIGGKLRTRIDDFHVTEQFLHPPKKDNGIFTIAQVSAKNWETHTLVQEIAQMLHCSSRRISFAGTKDKRAWSTQLMSFERIPADQLAQLHIKDVSIENTYLSDIPVRIGDLLGNHFDITIRNIESSVTPEQIKKILKPVESFDGLANFYGIQRFGITRPITHRVGKHIIHGEFEQAVMTYIATPLPREPEETYTLRKELQESRGYKQAFHSYPASLHFEKAILNSLIQNPHDFPLALQQLPKNLLLMFINAYESLLFNRILSERIKRNIPLNEASIGDVICPVKKNIITQDYIYVSAANIGKVNTQLLKKKAVITGVLHGYDTVYANGEMGEIEHMILASEGIRPQDFIIPDIPYLSSKGSRRSLIATISDLQWSLKTDEISPDEKQALTIQFSLPKGCYATSLLREIMKSNDPKNY